MIKTYALIKNGVVENVALWDGEADWSVPDEYQIAECVNGAAIGWTYVDGEFSPPPEVETA